MSRQREQVVIRMSTSDACSWSSTTPPSSSGERRGRWGSSPDNGGTCRYYQTVLLAVHVDGVEITHEALVLEWPRLRKWLDDDRLGLRLHQRLNAAANTWQQAGRDPAALYRGGLLASAR